MAALVITVIRAERIMASPKGEGRVEA